MTAAKILVIADEPLLRTALGRVLQSGGHEVSGERVGLR